MRWIGEIYERIEPIAYEECTFPKLRCSVINSVHFETIHVVTRIVQFLDIFCKLPYNRARFFVRLQCYATLIGTFADMPVPYRGRKQPSDVLHEEKSRLEDIHES